MAPLKFTQDILDLRRLRDNEFQSLNAWKPSAYHPSAYGGDIMAQALESCRRTVSTDFILSSFHCYFLRPRALDTPVVFHVDLYRDGSSFCSRSSVAKQSAKVIFTLHASFHKEAAEPISSMMNWCPPMPSVKYPEELPTLKEVLFHFRHHDNYIGTSRYIVHQNIEKQTSIDIRHVDPESALYRREEAPKVIQVWLRIKGTIGGDPSTHRSAAAYVCDFNIGITHLKTFPGVLFSQAGSLDHSMWFHKDIHVSRSEGKAMKTLSKAEEAALNKSRNDVPVANTALIPRSQIVQPIVDSDMPPQRFTQDILDLALVNENEYKSEKAWWPTEHHPSSYGGDTITQALESCRRTVSSNFNLNSCHCYFLRPRLRNFPAIYDVVRVRDGSTFSSRSVTVKQQGKVIFTLQASFHYEDAEPVSDIMNWYPSMPSVINPESLPCMQETLSHFADRNLNLPPMHSNYDTFLSMDKETSMEIRLIDAESTIFKTEGAAKGAKFWVRIRGGIDGNQSDHRIAAAYLSDYYTVFCNMKAFPNLIFTGGASLDHSMWFHRDVNMSEWNYMELRSNTMNVSRGLLYGYMWNRTGELVASFVQECLARVKL